MMHTRAAVLGVTAAVALATAASSCRVLPETAPESSAPGLTTISIGPGLHSGVKRFGINLGGQTFYDSGQMMKNLVFRNPGFEGETWQSFLRCRSVAFNTCVDDSAEEVWPAGFFNGASFEVIHGRAAGTAGTIASSGTAGGGHGVTLTLAGTGNSLAEGDTLLVGMEKPGGAEAGWWPTLAGGATLATEFHDLSPKTPGKQALRIDATGAGQSATVGSYFDSTPGRSFLQLRGSFSLRFRAKGLGGTRKLDVKLSRAEHAFLQREIPLTPTWRDYSFRFEANEDGSAAGTVALRFTARQASLLLDDVELTRDGTGNPTAYRDEVVETLRALNPGILRFMDNGPSFGSTFDDLIAPPFARRRGGWSFRQAEQPDIPMGLAKSLTLAQAIHAEPWYTLPATISAAEMDHLIEYFAAPATAPYGAKRASRGQQAPWTTVFPAIHLELGNEVWNDGDFGGASLPEPAVYASRVAAVFGAARQSPYFSPKFDLIAGGQTGNQWRTREFLKTGNRETSFAFAPYLFPTLNDTSSIEAVFGTMFAEPEAADSPGGLVAQDIALTRAAPHPAAAAIYEVNLGTAASKNNGIAQWQLDATLASAGGAVAVADHMLLMLRELGIVDQCLFALPGFRNRFNEPDGANKTIPLWGSVLDMGGPTNRRRPAYLALQLLNRAILSNELAIRLTGANPTWNRPASPNDGLLPSHPHLLQVFAFADGNRRSLIAINLSRAASLPIAFSGPSSPTGKVTVERLTSPNIADTNEDTAKVAIETRELSAFDPAAISPLPPFSITTVRWQVSP